MFDLVRKYRLLRHRYGHGVHSPFAYRLVRDVVYGRGIYYTVKVFRRLTDGFPKGLKREYQLLFRLVARLGPAEARIADSIEPQMDLLVRLADGRTVMAHGLGGYHRQGNVLSICEAADLYGGRVPEGILSDGNILWIRELQMAPEVLEAAIGAMPGGWVLYDKRHALLIANKENPLNKIPVKLT